MQKKAIRDFTQGSISKQLLVFAAPLFLSNLLQAIYNTVDMIVVGQLAGSVGLSAIAVGGDISNCLSFLAMGFSSAGQVIIAQYIGARKREQVEPFIGTMVSFLILCAAAMGVICLIFCEPILDILNTPPQSREMARDYARVCMVGLPFIYGYNAASAVFRGMGDSKRPFMIIALAAVLNLILDLVFVVGFKMSAFGAALATVIAQAVSFLFAAGYLIKNRALFGFTLSGGMFLIRKEQLMPLVKLGVPMAIRSASIQFSKLFVNSWINSYGVIISAVTGVASKLGNISNLIANSVNTAASSMIGQNIGAEKYPRVSRVIGVALVINLICAAALCGAVLFAPEAVFGVFSSDEQVLLGCMEYIPVAVVIFLGSALRSPMGAFINGSGNYRLNFAVAILDGIVMRIGLALLLGLALGMAYLGFWYGHAIAGFTPFFIGLFYYLFGNWKKRPDVAKD